MVVGIQDDDKGRDEPWRAAKLLAEGKSQAA
jgi:hypothetical protein